MTIRNSVTICFTYAVSLLVVLTYVAKIKAASPSDTAILSVEKSDAAVQVDSDYPGGNIVVDRIEGDDIYVHQDLRDTRGDWFYWNFRVRGAAGRTLTVHFTGSNAIGVRGPAVSSDGGKSWRWLGAVRDKSFRCTFNADALDVRFCLAIPYVQSNLDEFLQKYRKHPNLRVDTLCQSKKGRDVQRLHLGRLDGRPKHRVLITCRHHSCEMMASYSLEGLLSAMLSDSDDGRWLQEHVELLVVPFMDKDGVQDGDQGKNRKPHDHNRDYDGNSLYPEVKTLREFIPKWSDGLLRFALDMHDPGIRGDYHETIYLVENDGPTTENVRLFALFLEASRSGSLPFLAEDNLAFGTAWNTRGNYTTGMSFSHWAGALPDIRFAATVEIPYANVSGRPVTADSARAFGTDLAKALRKFLECQ